MIKTDFAVVVEGKYDRMKLEGIVGALVVTTDGFNIFKDEQKQRLLKRLAAETGVVIFTDSDEAGFRIRRFVSDICRGGRVLHAYIPDLAGKERRKQRPGRAGLLGVEGVPREAIERAFLDSGCVHIACGEGDDGPREAEARVADSCDGRFGVETATANPCAGAAGDYVGGPDGAAQPVPLRSGRTDGFDGASGRPCPGGDCAADDDRGEVTPADLYADGFSGSRGAAERRERLLLAANLPTRLSTSAVCKLLTRLYGKSGYQKLRDSVLADGSPKTAGEKSGPGGTDGEARSAAVDTDA